MVYIPFSSSSCLIAETNVQHLVRVCVYVCRWHMTVKMHYSDLPQVRNISALSDRGGGHSGNAYQCSEITSVIRNFCELKVVDGTL